MFGQYKKHPAVLLREVDGELLLLNTDTDTYFGLDPVGATMYRLLVDGLTRVDVVTRICEEFEVGAETAQRDLDGLATQLLDQGLLLEATG